MGSITAATGRNYNRIARVARGPHNPSKTSGVCPPGRKQWQSRLRQRPKPGRWAQSHVITISPPTSCRKNLDAGRAGKPAYIDVRGTHTYGQLADRVARVGAALWGLGV